MGLPLNPCLLVETVLSLYLPSRLSDAADFSEYPRKCISSKG